MQKYSYILCGKIVIPDNDPILLLIKRLFLKNKKKFHKSNSFTSWFKTVIAIAWICTYTSERWLLFILITYRITDNIHSISIDLFWQKAIKKTGRTINDKSLIYLSEWSYWKYTSKRHMPELIIGTAHFRIIKFAINIKIIVFSITAQLYSQVIKCRCCRK